VTSDGVFEDAVAVKASVCCSECAQGFAARWSCRVRISSRAQFPVHYMSKTGTVKSLSPRRFVPDHNGGAACCVRSDVGSWASCWASTCFVSGSPLKIRSGSHPAAGLVGSACNDRFVSFAADLLGRRPRPLLFLSLILTGYRRSGLGAVARARLWLADGLHRCMLEWHRHGSLPRFLWPFDPKPWFPGLAP